jgi:hypothetical protein
MLMTPLVKVSIPQKVYGVLYFMIQQRLATTFGEDSSGYFHWYGRSTGGLL